MIRVIKLKSGIAVIAAAMLIVLSGCGSIPFTVKDPGPTVEEIYRGTNGLTMKFMDNAPGDTAIEGGMIRAGFHLKNEGASDIKRGYLLLGLERSLLELYSWERGGNQERMTFDLRGKSMIIPDGEETYLFANIDTKNIGTQREVVETIISATACYDYHTTATTQICIDTDPYNMRITDKACTATDVALSSQGAPVAVSLINYEVGVSREDQAIKPRFRIKVSNVGNGKIIASGKADVACSAKQLGTDDLNVIRISAALSENELICEPSIIKMTPNQDYTICTLEHGIYEGQPSYSAPLEIKLEYGYMQTISKAINIKSMAR